MTPGDLFVRVPSRSAEEAYRFAAGTSGVGFSVGQGLLMAVGPAIVASVREHGPVFVEAELTGSAEEIGRAVQQLARFGAAWVSVSASAGPAAMAAAADASADFSCRVAASTVSVDLDDADVTSLFGTSRGKLVSRLAAAAAKTGLDGAICTIPDLGVVSQVAAGLIPVVPVAAPPQLREAIDRGARAAILDASGGPDVASFLEGASEGGG